jgi:oxidoreductase
LETIEGTSLNLSELEQQGKLVQHIMNLDELEGLNTKPLEFEAGFCCLGTTRSDAGSAEAFRKVDFGYATSFASWCKKSSIPQFHLVSSQGANSRSWFHYMKVKGEVSIL